MARTKIGSNAQFSGVGKGLTIIGSHCHGYSGEESVGSSNVNLLEFNTGKGYIVAKVQFSSTQSHTDNIQYQIRFNNITVFSYLITDATAYTDPDNPIRLVIPPLTYVLCMAKNISSGTTYTQNVALTGRVYDA